MAPAIKELSRWLDANSEYYVAPDWCDVVKHSVSRVMNEHPAPFRIFPSFSFVYFPPSSPCLLSCCRVTCPRPSSLAY